MPSLIDNSARMMDRNYFFLALFAAQLANTGCSRDPQTDIASVQQNKTAVHIKNDELKSQLQQESELNFPAEAIVTHYEKVSGSDLLIRSQLQLPKTIFENWISSYQLSLSDFSEEKHYLLGPDAEGWTPSSAGDLPTAQVMFDSGMVLNLAYQNVDADQVSVYLVFHGT
jgi:hypothetical protein